MTNDKELEEWKHRAKRAEQALASLLGGGESNEDMDGNDLVAIISSLTQAHGIFLALVNPDGVQTYSGYPEDEEFQDIKEIIMDIHESASNVLDKKFKRGGSVIIRSDGTVESNNVPGTDDDPESLS